MTTATPEIAFEEITPSTAEKLLKKNFKNRNLRPTIVDAYARDMQEGNWATNGEAIKISHDGVILDGQHRLSAIVKSDTTVRTLVVRGLESDSILSVDAGLRRSFADFLKLRGEKNSSALAAMVRGCYMYENRLVRTDTKPTYQELFDWFEQNPDIRDTIKLYCSKKEHGTYFSSGSFGVLHYYTALNFAEEVEAFIHTVCAPFSELYEQGYDLSPTSPPLVYRKHMDKYLNRKNSGAKIGHRFKLAILIKAWNRYIMGEDVKHLSWKPVGSRPEAFPTLITEL